jgi:ribonuclease PH
MRKEQRRPEEVRTLELTRHYTIHAGGSVLAAAGQTKVLCTASITDQVPVWLKGSGSGWVTAEYSMLPGSTPTRKKRDRLRGGIDGRSQEIQRLVGRSLRTITDLTLLGDHTIYLDCDVLQADGGTRTVALTGAWVALHDALSRMRERKLISTWPLKGQVAAVSAGIVAGAPLVDLDYSEDSKAQVDMNVVMTEDDRFIEIQGTGEQNPFSAGELTRLLDLAAGGIKQFMAVQTRALEPS